MSIIAFKLRCAHVLGSVHGQGQPVILQTEPYTTKTPKPARARVSTRPPRWYYKDARSQRQPKPHGREQALHTSPHGRGGQIDGTRAAAAT